MSSFAPVVVAITLLPVLLLGCAGEGVSDPGANQDPSVIALASSRSRSSTRRALNPAQTNIAPRHAGVKPNVDVPIPFERLRMPWCQRLLLSPRLERKIRCCLWGASPT